LAALGLVISYSAVDFYEWRRQRNTRASLPRNQTAITPYSPLLPDEFYSPNFGVRNSGSSNSS